MSYLRFNNHYDRFPETRVPGYDDEAWTGWDDIRNAIAQRAGEAKVLLADCYPGVDDGELLPNLVAAFRPETVILTEDLFFDAEALTGKMARFLTDDRVRGIMYYGEAADFMDPEKVKAAKERIRRSGRVLVYGFAASLLSDSGFLVYADLTRWEIQLRYRKGMPNYKQKNGDEDILRKVKRGYFVEWRIADRLKSDCFGRIDLYLDTNRAQEPNMVTGDALREGLFRITRTPFRLVPYFDPGVWGGQWMKEVCGLEENGSNYAWAFDGVPEENSLFIRFGGVRLETPAMNLTLMYPKDFLGPKNYARFGAEFPIRFDFLDTMGGQNLSLQVHPTTEYIHRKYGMSYTQDESYFILDCEEGGGVYLGLKENADPKALFRDLRDAQTGLKPFDAERYVNRWPAKKFDHFLIPAGTVHCSSAGCMVLEISATPYIFTFKLWDWGRAGLDGRPRPIHIDDGEKVIQTERTTEWVRENLINRFSAVHDGEDFRETRTGLHELEFIETHVYDVFDRAVLPGSGEFSMFNVADGRACVVESVTGSFDPLTLHYAETCILPAGAGDAVIRPADPREPVKIIRAWVRFP